MKSEEIRYSPNGVLALVALAAVYGLSVVVTRYLGDGIGVYEQWYLRYGIAFIAGMLLFYRRISMRKFLRLSRKEWAVLLFRSFIGQVFAIGLYTLAVQRTEIGLVSFLEVLPMSAILGVLLFHDKLSRTRAWLMALGFFGVALVVVENPRNLSELNVGAVLTLIGLVFYALMLVTRRWHSNALNNHEISVGMAGLSTLMTYVVSLVLYRRWIIPAAHWNWSFTLVLLAAGILSYSSNILSNYGFEHVSAIIAGNILTLQEIFGPLFGFIFYGEVLRAHDVAGGLIILLSVILMNQAARRERKDAQFSTVPE